MASLSPEARAARRRRVARLHRAGHSPWEIARRLKANPKTIARDLEALGLGAGAKDLSRRRERGTAPVAVPLSIDSPAAAVALAARLGDLAFRFTEGLRGEIGRLERILADERRRHAQELAAARAQGDRWRRELEGRLATETARADELQERVVFAERRAEVAISERAALERHVPSSVLLNGAVASPGSP